MWFIHWWVSHPNLAICIILVLCILILSLRKRTSECPLDTDKVRYNRQQVEALTRQTAKQETAYKLHLHRLAEAYRSSHELRGKE